MSGIELNDFEKKILEILKKKEENIYHRILEKLNLEERRANPQDRAVRYFFISSGMVYQHLSKI